MRTRQKTGAVIVAAGESKRMGGIDKMWALINGKPVLAHPLEAFLNCDAIDHIVIVLNKKNLKQGRLLKKELDSTEEDYSLHRWDTTAGFRGCRVSETKRVQMGCDTRRCPASGYTGLNRKVS